MSYDLESCCTYLEYSRHNPRPTGLAVHGTSSQKTDILNIITPHFPSHLSDLVCGHAIAHVVSCQLLPVVAQVCTEVSPVGSVVDKVALEQVFLGVLQFPLICITAPFLRSHLCVISGMDNGPIGGHGSIKTRSYPP